MTSASACGRVQWEGLHVKDDGKLGLGYIDLGWTVSGDTGPDVWN